MQCKEYFNYILIIYNIKLLIYIDGKGGGIYYSFGINSECKFEYVDVSHKNALSKKILKKNY